jgi:predicted NodU family carbamoyl transferase
MNTSLNVSGKPIAGYIKDIKLEFLNNKKIDMLVIGDDIYER